MFRFLPMPNLLRDERGLSLMEILIALTLIGIAGTIIVGNLFENLEEGKVQTTEIQIRELGQRLKEFRRHCGAYPSTDQGLDALINNPGQVNGKECRRYLPSGYIEGGKVPLDPWDNEYVYESDGRNFNILSYGADGQPDGEGFDADINSKDL